jgi:hypothetical protein
MTLIGSSLARRNQCRHQDSQRSRKTGFLEHNGFSLFIPNVDAGRRKILRWPAASSRRGHQGDAERPVNKVAKYPRGRGRPRLESEPPAAAATRVQAAPAPIRSAPAVQAAAPQPVPVTEECWDEVVEVASQPYDEKKITGTALGALVGGAIGKDVGDRDLTTAAGAAAGALIGRKIQNRVQENRATTTTTTERRCAPVGTR